MQAQINSFAITANSAYATLLILDRQARRDTSKVIRFSYRIYCALTSAEAKRTYRLIWSILQLVGMVAIACFSTMCDWCESYVQSQLTEPLESPNLATSEPVEPITPASEAPAIAPITNTAISHAAPIWREMNSVQLRKECQQRQIAWRNAHGKGKHLTKGEMLRLLSRAAA